MTRDARLSALHRGGFGLRGRASSPAFAPVRSRGPEPPGASGYEPQPQDATPRSAFRREALLIRLDYLCFLKINPRRDPASVIFTFSF